MNLSARLSFLLTLTVLAAPLGWFGWMVAQRPPQTNEARSLFQGVQYQRTYRSSPRPIMIHTVKIDLTAPGIKALVTPADPKEDDLETSARTPSEFVTEHKLQLAVNANFFYPFHEKTPWDYYPYSGDRVNSLGISMSNGNTYSPAEKTWPALCIHKNQRAQIVAAGTCPNETVQAVAGIAVIAAQGKVVQPPYKDVAAYSRTAVAVDRTGKTLWLIAIDDKQWLYSEGMTLKELAEFALQQGADTVLSLDGGGSTSLVISTPTGTQALNAPVHTKIPMRERPVANHLGFYANPK
jgi:exopolysaccharide biosynthesis protein